LVFFRSGERWWDNQLEKQERKKSYLKGRGGNGGMMEKERFFDAEGEGSDGGQKREKKKKKPGGGGKRRVKKKKVKKKRGALSRKRVNLKTEGRGKKGENSSLGKSGGRKGGRNK